MAGSRIPGYRDPLARREERKLAGLVNIPRKAKSQPERVQPLPEGVELPAQFVNTVWPQLSMPARAVLIPLIQLWNANNHRPFRATVPEIAARAGVSQPTVRKAIRELDAAGVITLTPCPLGLKDGHTYQVTDLSELVATP